MARLQITLKGVDQVHAALGALALAAPEELAGALYEEAETIRTESIAQVPVDTGVLKSTAFVNPPETIGTQTFVTIGYGGAAKDYAVVQHEDLTLFHDDGNAKFLELPFLAHAKDLGARLAARVKARLGL